MRAKEVRNNGKFPFQVRTREIGKNKRCVLLSESKKSGKRRKKKGKETALGSGSECRLLVCLGL
jgi:hypothetical protein